jgi:hypothetical protein
LFLVMWTGKIPKGRVNSGYLNELSLISCLLSNIRFKKMLSVRFYEFHRHSSFQLVNLPVDKAENSSDNSLG